MRSRFAHLRLAGLWRHPDFLRLWSAETVSLLGTQATLLAVPLTAALLLDASPRQMGILGALGGAAAFFCGFLSGAFVDRLRRKPVLVGTDLSNALIISSVPLAWLLGTLSMAHLYAVEFLVGGLSTVSYVTAQSWLPSVVGRERLIEANGKLRASEALSQVGGPSLAGALAQLVGAPLVLAVDCLSYLVSALLVGSVRTTEPKQIESKEKAETPRTVARIAKETVEGLRWVFSHPVLRALLASSTTFSLFSGFFAALFVIFATRELGLSPAMVGSVLAIQGTGSVLGALMAERIASRLGLGRALVLAAAGQGLGWLLLPFAGAFGIPALPVLALGLAIAGFCFVVYVVGAVSLRQALTPDGLLGRVNASAVSLILAASPFGALLGGILAEETNSRSALGLGALVGALGFLWTFFSPVRGIKNPDPKFSSDDVES